MLNCCVLLGLDWAEPMIVFLFACHMFMHFHAYVSSFLYILIYWCVWYFSACHSFSLSLSLLVSCIMSPKRKSTLSQNPLCFGASTSSFDLTPSHVWFHDDKAWKDFSKKFCQQGIHSERQVILLDFSNTDLPTVIHSRGGGSLCDIPVICPSVIIQEFYFNMHGINTFIPHFFSPIRDTCIVATPDIASEVLRS